VNNQGGNIATVCFKDNARIRWLETREKMLVYRA